MRTLAADPGAPDPGRLGDQSALLHDGARAQVLDDVTPLEHAREPATMLLDAALSGR